MGIFSEAVEVERSPSGELVRLIWRGVSYSIAQHPLCWYERRRWWELETRVPPGEGVGVVDTQMWRFQLHREGIPDGLTLDVARYRPADRWRVIKIHEAVEDVFKEVLGGA